MARRSRRTLTKAKKQAEEETLVDIFEVKDNVQDFWERNQTKILGIAFALIVVIGGYLGYKYLVKIPKNNEALAQMFTAENAFVRDSFTNALTNPGGGFPGFTDIVDEYGSTGAGNIANYYSAISYLNLGNYDAAMDYLKDFKPGGSTVGKSMKNGLMGDCHSEKQDFTQALSYYKKAAGFDHDFLSPFYLKKAALLSEKQGQKAEAIKYWSDLRSKYPSSVQSADAEKYLARLAK